MKKKRIITLLLSVVLGVVLGFWLSKDHSFYMYGVYFLMYLILAISVILELVSLIRKSKLNKTGNLLLLIWICGMTILKFNMVFVVVYNSDRSDNIIYALNQYNSVHGEYPDSLEELGNSIDLEDFVYKHKDSDNSFLLQYSLSAWKQYRYISSKQDWFEVNLITNPFLGM